MSTTRNSITLPPVDILGRAGATLAEQAAGDTKALGALNKAQYHLALGDVSIVHVGDGFAVTSATRAGLVHKVSHVHGCSCEAAQNGRACWHAAAIAILEECGKYVMPAMGDRLAAARRPLMADYDAETRRLAAKDEMRAQLELVQARRAAARAEAAAIADELFG